MIVLENIYQILIDVNTNALAGKRRVIVKSVDDVQSINSRMMSAARLREPSKKASRSSAGRVILNAKRFCRALLR